MFKSKVPNPKKALKLEKKGDLLFNKGKFQKALKKYQKSESLNPDRPEIYKKLTETFNQMDVDWTEEDFNESMTWTIRQQELENPEVRQVYEKFSTEYQAVTKLVQQLMVSPDSNTETKLKDKILTFDKEALLPLLDFLLSIKQLAQQTHAQEGPLPPQPNPPPDPP